MKEVAELMQVSESTIRRRIADGSIPRSNLVKHIRIPAWYIEEMKKKNEN